MPEETPMEANVLLTIHNSDAMFENFSFVNESNIIKTDPNTTAQTGQSKSQALGGRRNSFDDDTPLELDSLPGDQSGSQASDEDLKKIRKNQMFGAELEQNE